MKHPVKVSKLYIYLLNSNLILNTLLNEDGRHLSSVGLLGGDNPEGEADVIQSPLLSAVSVSPSALSPSKSQTVERCQLSAFNRVLRVKFKLALFYWTQCIKRDLSLKFLILQQPSAFWFSSL